MDELSLEDLTAQLQAVQKKTTTARLSERNIIELVNKLKELGLLGDDLLYTINGQEYITTDKLREEIKEALNNYGGRLPLTDLPALLNVDLHHCECQVGPIVEESQGLVVEYQGELITIKYFDNVAIEVNDLLEGSGMLKIGDLAIQYSLSSEMVLSILSPRLGTMIKGHLQGGMIYTSKYINRIKAQLQGAIRGITSPTSIAAIGKSIGLEESGISNLISGIVDGLLSEQAIQGQVRSGSQWVPAMYVRAQQVAVRSFYNQNGWVALETIRRLGTQSDEAFIQENLPNATQLHSTLVSSGLIAQIDAEIKEIVSSQMWCDVVEVMPSEFSAKDASLALGNCPSINGTEGTEQLKVFADTFVVSPAFVQDCVDRAKQEGKALADKALKNRQEMAKGSGSTADRATQDKKPLSHTLVADDEDDWGDSGKGKGKKKGKGKAKGKGKTGAGQAPGGPRSVSSASEPPSSFYPTRETLSPKIAEWYPDIEDGCEEGTLGYALLDSMVPAAANEYNEAIRVATRTVSQSRRQIKEGAMSSLEESAQRLWLYTRGADLLKSDDATYVIINKALVRGTGAETVDWLLRLMQLQEPNSEVPEPLVPIPAPERAQVASTLPADMGKEALQAIDALKEEDPKIVLSAVEAGAESLSLRFKKMDKKLEKQKVLELRTTLMEQLKVETAPSAALAQALPLLFAKAHDKALSIPGRAMPGVIKFLSEGLEKKEHSVLERMHKLVVDALKAQAAKEDETVKELTAQLDECFPLLRSVCGL